MSCAGAGLPVSGSEACSQSGVWSPPGPMAASRMGDMDPIQPPTLDRFVQLAPQLLALTAAHGGRDLRVHCCAEARASAP
jgi:hypothetical protein